MRIKMIQHHTAQLDPGVAAHYARGGVFEVDELFGEMLIADGKAGAVGPDDEILPIPSPAAGTVTVDQNTET